MTRTFVRTVERFAHDEGVDLVSFRKWERMANRTQRYPRQRLGSQVIDLVSIPVWDLGAWLWLNVKVTKPPDLQPSSSTSRRRHECSPLRRDLNSRAGGSDHRVSLRGRNPVDRETYTPQEANVAVPAIAPWTLRIRTAWMVKYKAQRGAITSRPR